MKELVLAALVGASPVVIDTSSLDQGQMEEFLLMETSCLATNIYHEARNQGTAGWIAVMAVTLNRVNDDRFPNTICGVVKEGEHRPSWKDKTVMVPIKNRCQFSWYCDGLSDKITNKEIYNRIYDLSYEVVYGNIELIDITDGATHYHADYVSPSWSYSKTKTVEIADHIFYRWEKKK